MAWYLFYCLNVDRFFSRSNQAERWDKQFPSLAAERRQKRGQKSPASSAARDSSEDQNKLPEYFIYIVRAEYDLDEQIRSTKSTDRSEWEWRRSSSLYNRENIEDWSSIWNDPFWSWTILIRPIQQTRAHRSGQMQKFAKNGVHD